MLYDAPPGSDGDTVRRWLRAALEAGAARGQSAAALARHCGVTPQAVNGWLSTGRISKTNLAQAAAYFGHGPDFSARAVQPVLAREPSAPGAWPFRQVTYSEVMALPRQRLHRLDRLLRARIDEWAEDDAARDGAAPTAEKP